MKNLISELSKTQDVYDYWFETASETQESMLWSSIWDHAAQTAPENEFVVGCYNFYQNRGYLTYRQFVFLVKTLYPELVKPHSLKDRLAKPPNNMQVISKILKNNLH